MTNREKAYAIAQANFRKGESELADVFLAGWESAVEECKQRLLTLAKAADVADRPGMAEILRVAANDIDVMLKDSRPNVEKDLDALSETLKKRPLGSTDGGGL